MRWLRGLLTWQVAAPIVAYILSALLVVAVLDAFVARHEAISARNKTEATDAALIDQLNNEITHLQHRITNDARERGRLEEVITLLAQQVRRRGGTPVATVSSTSGGGASSASTVTPRPSPTPTRPPKPHPTSSSSPPPTPSPSPSCSLAHPLRCLPV